jgi:hypothetical protein
MRVYFRRSAMNINYQDSSLIRDVGIMRFKCALSPTQQETITTVLWSLLACLILSRVCKNILVVCYVIRSEWDPSSALPTRRLIRRGTDL